MNAVEIEQAITDLAEKPFDAANFPYAFLEAFGNKETTIKRLRAGASNKSDLGGVLQTSNIHILTCSAEQVTSSLKILKDSPATTKAKARFILATDGVGFEAEDLTSGETVACAFKDFPDHFGFFLPLAGISVVRQISENAFDIRATSRLNRLYVELLKDNPEWGKAERRHDKDLNPLFLDDLRAKLEEAGNNPRSLLNLRKRIAKIRVFDPACGSGNFLVIAYKEMRAIEAEINKRRGERDIRSIIPLTNFRGIELRDFPAEIARLALVIAGFQCDVLYRGHQLALAEFLPLRNENWITCGNALRLDWLSICPPTGTGVKVRADDLFSTPLDQAEIDFANEGGETYICGNPPYKGSKWQSDEQKADLANAWTKHPKLAKTTDFVTGWIARFLDYADSVANAVGAFVATNSICQGQQASGVWPLAFKRGYEIRFAHTSFKWANLASRNAGVTVVIVGIGKASGQPKKLYLDELLRQCTAIGPYLVPDSLACVQQASDPLGEQSTMLFGNMPRDGGSLLLGSDIAERVANDDPIARPFIKRFVGSDELIKGKLRYCLWIEENDVAIAKRSDFIAQRLDLVAESRRKSDAESTRQFATQSHRFVQIAGTARRSQVLVPGVSSENRPYLRCDYLTADIIASNKCFALYDAPLWNMALIGSRLHLVWIATVRVRMRTDFSYSNTLGWNTFPVPTLTDKNKADLTRCAEDILLAREHHFPATIADLYDPDAMPADLRAAHDRNDEVLERIYIGRRFKNDTERLEKLFDLYTKMTAGAAPAKAKKRKGASA